jgi:hypothetical protein
MSCGCCNPNITIAPTICCNPTVESVEYTAENVNAIGIGVLNGTTGTNFEFRGIASDTLALTVTLDAPNNAIIISFNDELLIDDIPTATETVRGIAEVATQGETNAGALDDKIITPLKLFSMLATETQRGILEIATQAEVTTGTNDTNAITPLKLATNLTAQKLTRTFADAVARAAAVPDFDGQLGNQLDNNALIVSTGTIAGTFTPNMVFGGTLAVTGNIAGATADLTGLSVVGNTDFTGNFVGDGTSWQFLNYNIDFTGVTLSASGTPFGATDMGLGQYSGSADGKPLSQFISTSNLQSGYTPVTNGATIRTYDCNTVTLPQLAQALGTLFEDLKATKHPSA